MLLRGKLPGMLSPGTPGWLICAEHRFGGITKGVKRNKVSPRDPRSKEKIGRGGMIGGDRMWHHGYASKYSEYLLPYCNKENIVLAEFGILKGTGLAIWCDLFRSGRVLGFDIDLGHINGNMENLKSLGAFSECAPELHEFDQFVENEGYVGNILKGQRIDICIDDGFQSEESILTTMKSVIPHMADEFVYFIEDNDQVHKKISEVYPHYSIDSVGELTIVSTK